MNPYLIIGAIAICLGATASGYFKGRSDANANCEIKIAGMVADAQKQRDAEAETAAAASSKLEADNAKARDKFKAITKSVNTVVERPSYRTQCFDDDGLRLIREALSGPSTDPRKPAKPVSGSAAAGIADIRTDAAPHH